MVPAEEAAWAAVPVGRRTPSAQRQLRPRATTHTRRRWLRDWQLVFSASLPSSVVEWTHYLDHGMRQSPEIQRRKPRASLVRASRVGLRSRKHAHIDGGAVGVDLIRGQSTTANGRLRARLDACRSLYWRPAAQTPHGASIEAGPPGHSSFSGARCTWTPGVLPRRPARLREDIPRSHPEGYRDSGVGLSAYQSCFVRAWRGMRRPPPGTRRQRRRRVQPRGGGSVAPRGESGRVSPPGRSGA